MSRPARLGFESMEARRMLTGTSTDEGGMVVSLVPVDSFITISGTLGTQSHSLPLNVYVTVRSLNTFQPGYARNGLTSMNAVGFIQQDNAPRNDGLESSTSPAIVLIPNNIPSSGREPAQDTSAEGGAVSIPQARHVMALTMSGTVDHAAFNHASFGAGRAAQPARALACEMVRGVLMEQASSGRSRSEVAAWSKPMPPPQPVAASITNAEAPAPREVVVDASATSIPAVPRPRDARVNAPFPAAQASKFLGEASVADHIGAEQGTFRAGMRRVEPVAPLETGQTDSALESGNIWRHLLAAAPLAMFIVIHRMVEASREQADGVAGSTPRTGTPSADRCRQIGLRLRPSRA